MFSEMILPARHTQKFINNRNLRSLSRSHNSKHRCEYSKNLLAEASLFQGRKNDKAEKMSEL